MESLAQRCVRVAEALLDLAEQEAAAVANRDYASVAALQDRTAPLVHFLTNEGRGAMRSPDVRERILAVRARRRESEARLSAALASAGTELQETRTAQRRIARIAPVYSRSEAVRPRLLAQG